MLEWGPPDASPNSMTVSFHGPTPGLKVMSSRLPIETGSQCRGSFLGSSMPSGMSPLSQKAGLC
eukprot:12429755-Heterocapsa_arctica.AAC.1